MESSIIDLHLWLQSPPGLRVLAWERVRVGDAVSDVFGFRALQLGLPGLDALANNRMPHKWLATGLSNSRAGLTLPIDVTYASDASEASEASETNKMTADLACDWSALPFAENSLDLVVMPHALEFCSEPHAALREVARVLVPEGRLVLTGFNPASLWGLRQVRQRWMHQWVGNTPLPAENPLFLPTSGEFIAYARLRDWLRLLSFEVEAGQFGVYEPAAHSEKWLQRMHWLNALGERWWPGFGAVYCVTAVKRVRGMRMLTPVRRKSVFLHAPVSIANKGMDDGQCANLSPVKV